jgi:hypothetical protein
VTVANKYMNNSLVKGLIHGVVTFVLFAIPLALTQTGWTSVTIGSILTAIYQAVLHYNTQPTA